MRARKKIRAIGIAAAVAALSAALGTLSAGSASAASAPWAPGTVFVADQGSHLTGGGVVAITPNGAQSTIFNSGTAVDVATDGNGNVYFASCNLGAVVKLPSAHPYGDWIASGKGCVTAVAVEPSGDVLFSAAGAIYRVPADGSADPVVAVPDQSASSMAVDDDGDIWLADSGTLSVVTPGSSTAVRVQYAANSGLDSVRSVRFAPNHQLLAATAFGESAVQLSADLKATNAVTPAGGYATGAVVNGRTFVADDTNRRIVAGRGGSSGPFATGLDDPRGLALYPPVPSTARTRTTVALSTTAPSSFGFWKPVALKAVVGTAAGSVSTGLVQFSIDGQPLGDAVPVRSGAARLTANLPVGNPRVVATYLGAISTAPSASNGLDFTVAAATTTTTLTTTSPASAPQNQPVPVSVEVTSAHGVPGGIVEIKANGATVAGLPLDENGHAAGEVTLAPGVQHLRATYTGDGTSFLGSRSATTDLTMTTPYAPTLNTEVSVGRPHEDGSTTATITLTVTGFAGQPAPTGTVTADNGFACGTLSPLGVKKARATCTADVQPGFYDVNLAYSGDATFGAAATDVPVFAWGGGGEG